MKAVRRQQQPVFNGVILDCKAGFAAERSRHDALERDASEVLVACRPVFRNTLPPYEEKRPRPVGARGVRSGNLDLATRPRQRAVADRIDRELVQGEAQMQGGVRSQIGICALDLNGALGVGSITRNLPGNKLAVVGAPPVGGGDQILL